VKVLVDTDVWSEAFRKKGASSPYVSELIALIEEDRVQLIGPIRQEILCGIRNAVLFKSFGQRLDAFPDRVIESDVFVTAARFFNLCRSQGVQGSNTDFLICACSVSWGMPILSKDKDYQNYQKHLPIEQLEPRLRK
jgi:predicted nucleic acid-binding protein